MARILFLFLLYCISVNALELVSPYPWQVKDENARRLHEWDRIVACKPPDDTFIKTYVKPPGNLAGGDQAIAIGGKFLANEENIVLDQAKNAASKAVIESNPSLQKTMDKAQAMAPKVQATTFSIKHDFKYDLPSNTALYMAQADSVNFTWRHETYNSMDHASLAYKVNPECSYGIRVDSPFTSPLLFLESKW